MKHSFFIKSWFILILLSILPRGTYASSVVKYISNINGLTNNSVNCILEDSEHTVWIGTWDGLNAYNGREVKTYRYSNNNPYSISNNIIRQIIEQDNKLWVATDNGINRLDQSTGHFTRYYLREGDKIPNQENTFILGKTKQNIITCFVKNQGLFYFDATVNQFSEVKIDFANQIKDYIIDGNNQAIFLLTDGTVRYLSIGNPAILIKKSSLKSLPIGAPINKIFLSDNHFILSTDQEVMLLDEKFSISKTIRLETRKALSYALLLKNQLYLSFIEGGCVKYDLSDSNHSYINEVPRQMSVFTIYAGSQNILWAGTDGHGVIQLYSYHSPFQTTHTPHAVRAFCEDVQGNILIGTKGSGIKYLDVQTKQLSDFLSETTGLTSNSVYALQKNRSGDIFVGTEGAGLTIIHAHTGQVEILDIPKKYPFFKAVYNLHFTNNDSLLWIGTSGYGLIKMVVAKEKNRYQVRGVEQYTSSTQSNPVNNDIVYAIASDSKNDFLWFGTRGGGLNRIDIRRNSIERLEDIDNSILLTNNDILCLLNDDNGLWIGTSYGLNRLSWKGEKSELTQYVENAGLSNNTIHGIVKDSQGKIWLSTNKGLSCLNLSTSEIKNYTLNDGLQNDEFSDGAFFKDQRNRLYFGGVSGLNGFDPLNILLRDFTPPLALSDLKIYNTSQDVCSRTHNGVLELGYNERFVTFTFIAKDFINNENCEYAYRLINHSSEWIYMGNNPNIVFTQIPPGEYQLEVKGTNGDKVWGNLIYKLTVDVAFPWWLSLPAFLLYGLFAVIVLFITRSIIRNKIRLNRQILISQVEKQHEQRMYESKLNFFTNVAHEFFTPLTLIYGPAQHLLEQRGTDQNMRKYLLIIKNNAERMQKLISELMEFRKAKSGYTPLYAENIDIKQLAEEIAGNYAEILKENKIDFRLNIRNVSDLYSDRNSLEKIVFNLLSNAFKYTPRNGYIYLDVWQESSSNNALRVVIRNSGKGLTERQMAEIFDRFKIFDVPRVGNSVSTGIGLNLTKSLTELLGGKVEVSSELGKYVEFDVTIPPLSADVVKVMDGEAGFVREAVHVQRELKPRKETVVLIVEDEDGIRELLKDVLSDYTIKEASDGKGALIEVEKNHPDIVITDILMPTMSGLALIDSLKSNSKTSYIPIIGISAKASIEEQIEAYNHGADAYITKPFHPGQVISAIENLISRQTLLKDYFNSSLSSIKVKDGIELHFEDEELIRVIVDYIKKNIDDESLSPNSVAEFIGVSKATLYRKFKEITDKTPSEFIRTIKLEYAAKLLRTTKLTVSEIMYKSGFSNKSYFYREFLKQYGVSPKDYRNH